MDPANATAVAAPMPAMGMPPALPALDDTMGAYLLGTAFGLLLQGVVYLQAYQYFCLFPKDPWWLKSWVILLVVVETINTVLPLHSCYYNLVSNYFKPQVLAGPPVWSLKFLPVPGSIAALITQIFFARRVYLIDRRYRLIALVAGALTVAFAGCYIALTGLGWNATSIDDYLKFSWLSSLGSSMIMASDIMMTAILIYFLRKNHTGITRTDTMLDIIVMYTVTSGLVICVFNVLNVTFALVWPRNLIFAATSIILTKLYSNTFLVSLNTRQSLIARGVVMEASAPFSDSIVKRSRPTASGSNHRRIEVPIEIEHYVSSEGMSDTSTVVELRTRQHMLGSKGRTGTMDGNTYVDGKQSLVDAADAV